MLNPKYIKTIFCMIVQCNCYRLHTALTNPLVYNYAHRRWYISDFTPEDNISGVHNSGYSLVVRTGVDIQSRSYTAQATREQSFSIHCSDSAHTGSGIQSCLNPVEIIHTIFSLHCTYQPLAAIHQLSYMNPYLWLTKLIILNTKAEWFWPKNTQPQSQRFWYMLHKH